MKSPKGPGSAEKPRINRRQTAKQALVLHSDMGVISALQTEFTRQGITTIVARDLPTALLAITQHYLDMAVISSRISEEGDGWPVAGILRLIFPKAFVVVMAGQTDVLTLRSAINNGVDEVCEAISSPEQIVGTVLKRQSAAKSLPTVQ